MNEINVRLFAVKAFPLLLFDKAAVGEVFGKGLFVEIQTQHIRVLNKHYAYVLM